MSRKVYCGRLYLGTTVTVVFLDCFVYCHGAVSSLLSVIIVIALI